MTEKAGGVDEIMASVLKVIAESISLLLQYIFNMSIKRQFGFMKNKGTKDALPTKTNYIYKE